MCGKAPLFRPESKILCGYAAGLPFYFKMVCEEAVSFLLASMIKKAA